MISSFTFCALLEIVQVVSMFLILNAEKISRLLRIVDREKELAARRGEHRRQALEDIKVHRAGGANAIR